MGERECKVEMTRLKDSARRGDKALRAVGFEELSSEAWRRLHSRLGKLLGKKRKGNNAENAEVITRCPSPSRQLEPGDLVHVDLRALRRVGELRTAGKCDSNIGELLCCKAGLA